MALPGQNITITDPGLGTVAATDRNVLHMGTSSAGTVDTLKSFSVKQDVVDYFGQGPLSEGMCRTLDIAGGPVYGMKLTGSVPGASGAVTPARVSTSTGTVTVSTATAYDSYRVIVEITKSGAIGVGQFKYSLDYTTNSTPNRGQNFSGELLIPGGPGTYVIPDTGLTITFADLAGPINFEDGDTFRFDCTAPLYSTSNLDTAFVALLLTTTDLATISLEGEHATATSAATMFGAFDLQLTAMAAQQRYVRGIMDGGSLEDDRAAAITAHAASVSTRVGLCYGYEDVASSKPITGWGNGQRSLVGSTTSRMASVKVSTDGARVASGSVVGVTAIRTDEFRSPLLDAEKFITRRTFQGVPGIYITNVWLRSGPGSDFKYWQHGAVMDVACATVVAAQTPFIARSVRTNSDGTINETDATQMEKTVQSALRAALKDPTNQEGTKGHVSDFGYSIDRTNDLLGTGIMNTTTKIRPLGYPKILNADIGFSKAV